MNEVNLNQLNDDLDAVYQKHGGRADILFGMLLGQALRFGDMLQAVKSTLGDSEEQLTREEFLDIAGKVFDSARAADAQARGGGGG